MCLWAYLTNQRFERAYLEKRNNLSQFEYKIIDDVKGINPDSEEDLNWLGEQGWELVSINPYQTLYGTWRKWYFKRQKVETNEQTD